MSLTKTLIDRGLHISCPKWLPDNTQYETIMGSIAYGVSTDDSDVDIYGFCIPKQIDIFPHLDGEIQGFGRQKKRFESWQEHHIIDKEARKEYDFTIFNIVKYFALLMDNNPNIVNSLWVPQDCIITQTEVAHMVRAERKIFLHKGCKFRFVGYAFSQLHKMETKEFEGSEKRKAEVKKYGFSLKFAYHLVRLLDECKQILIEGDLDIRANGEKLKAIRRGEWTMPDIKAYFDEQEKVLEKLYIESKLQHSPDESKIKQLLLNCLEHHYGSLEKCIVNPDKYLVAINKIAEIIKEMGV